MKGKEVEFKKHSGEDIKIVGKLAKHFQKDTYRLSRIFRKFDTSSPFFQTRKL